MITEALARVLLDYRRTITDTDQVKAIDLHQAQQMLRDPGPLLAALAEAGVLTRRTEVFNGYHCGHRETWMETQRDRVEWSDDGGMD